MNKTKKAIDLLKSTFFVGEEVKVVRPLLYYPVSVYLAVSEVREKCFAFEVTENEFKLLDEISISEHLPLGNVLIKEGRVVDIILNYEKGFSKVSYIPLILAGFNLKTKRFFNPKNALGGVNKKHRLEINGYTLWSPLEDDGFQMLDPMGVSVSIFEKAPQTNVVGQYGLFFDGNFLKVIWDVERKKKIEFPFNNVVGFEGNQFITDKEGEYALSYASGQLLKLANGQISVCPTVVNSNVFYINTGDIRVSEQLGLLKFNREHYPPEIYSIQSL